MIVGNGYMGFIILFYSVSIWIFHNKMFILKINPHTYCLWGKLKVTVSVYAISAVLINSEEVEEIKSMSSSFLLIM